MPPFGHSLFLFDGHSLFFLPNHAPRHAAARPLPCFFSAAIPFSFAQPRALRRAWPGSPYSAWSPSPFSFWPHRWRSSSGWRMATAWWSTMGERAHSPSTTCTSTCWVVGRCGGRPAEVVPGACVLKAVGLSVKREFVARRRRECGGACPRDWPGVHLVWHVTAAQRNHGNRGWCEAGWRACARAV